MNQGTSVFTQIISFIDYEAHLGRIDTHKHLRLRAAAFSGRKEKHDGLEAGANDRFTTI